MDVRLHHFQALGTPCVLGVTEPQVLEAAWSAVKAEIDDCDRACSRFRDDSDLSRLNAGAGHFVAVSDRFLDDLEAAVRAAELTDGAVDPSIGRALVVLGYDRDFALIGQGGDGDGPRAPRLTLTPAPGWRTVEIDRRRSVARVASGVRIDLGATAKARCADRAARQATVATGAGIVVSLGGDISLAGPVPTDGWRVRVTDSSSAPTDAPGQTIRLDSGALATSSVTVRSWSRSGERVHHLIDPSTGDAAQVVWRTVSVVAADCLDANIASTASIILGHRAPAWLEAQGLCARLVAPDGTVRTVGGWPTDEPTVVAGLEVAR
jgi:thiamine biosynthesis lipoprotein